MDPLQNPTKLKTTKPTAVFFKLFHTIQRERTAPNSFCEASITLPKDKDMHAYKRRETERQRQKDTERL